MNFEQDYLALIFDCDGTLTDSMPLHYVAWRRTLDRYGIVFAEERFYAMGGVPSEKIIDILCAEQGIAGDAKAIAAEKEREFLLNLDDVRPNLAVCEIARRHHGRMPMAVASGGIRSVVLDQLNQIEMRPYFEVIVAAEDTARHKPEPDVFLEAARRLRVEPTRCLVFEDTDIGITAARQAGMSFVDVRSLLGE